MTANESNANERIDSRTERALTQYLTVLPDTGRARGADGLYLVVSQSGTEYLVDSREGRCTCPDHEHRQTRCKHLRRVGFATGEEPIPTGVDGVDSKLGEHVNTSPSTVATDGGTDVIEAGDDTESLNETPTWDGPFTEYDKYGRPTGHAYVRCSDCGIEVLTGDKGRSFHRPDCRLIGE